MSAHFIPYDRQIKLPDGLRIIELRRAEDRTLFASLIGHESDIHLSLTSVMDHLDEPRDPSTYSIQMDDKSNWSLLWEPTPDNPLCLGTITAKKDAQCLLLYLKANAR